MRAFTAAARSSAICGLIAPNSTSLFRLNGFLENLRIETSGPSTARCVCPAWLVAAIFQHDLRVLPEKAFEPFGIAASTFPPDFQPHAAIYWAVAIAIFFVNLVRSLRSGEIAGDDPWDAFTLEWSTTSPPPPENFASIPAVTGRRPLWDRKHPESRDRR